MSIKSVSNQAQLLILVGLLTTQAQAITFIFNGDSKVIGFDNVEYDGENWRVDLIDGSFQSVYGDSLIQDDTSTISYATDSFTSPLVPFQTQYEANTAIRPIFDFLNSPVNSAYLTPAAFYGCDPLNTYCHFTSPVNIGIYSGSLLTNVYGTGVTLSGRDAVPSALLFYSGGGDISLDATNRLWMEWTISSVPIPAAVWLFGSGLIGLIGIARRKKA